METARSIVLYRLNVPKDKWTVDALEKEGILSHEDASRLMKCIIVSP
jgi:hypothetical protein